VRRRAAIHGGYSASHAASGFNQLFSFNLESGLFLKTPIRLPLSGRRGSSGVSLKKYLLFVASRKRRSWYLEGVALHEGPSKGWRAGQKKQRQYRRWLKIFSAGEECSSKKIAYVSAVLAGVAKDEGGQLEI